MKKYILWFRNRRDERADGVPAYTALVQGSRLEPVCQVPLRSPEQFCQQRDHDLLFHFSHRPGSAILNYFSLRKHLIEAISRPYFYYSNEIHGTNHIAETDLEPPFPFLLRKNKMRVTILKNGAQTFTKNAFGQICASGL